MKAYTMREMKNVVQYLVEHEAYGQTKGRKLWMNLADSSLTDRSWQSLKENFQKRILPDIHNPYYGLSMEQIRSFRQGRDLTTKDVPLSQDLLPANENVKANSANPISIAENMEADNDVGEEDSQSTSSHSSSSMERLVIDESSNQEGGESDECSENISSKKLTITQPVVEVSDNVTERFSLTQNGRVSPINSDSECDVMPIRRNCSHTESRINESLPVNNRDKSPVKNNSLNIGPSRKQQTNKDHSDSTKNVQSKSVLSSDSHFRNDPHESLKGFNNDEITKAIQEKACQETKKRNILAYSNRRNSMTVRSNCQKTNISENRDCHVSTINDSRDNENVRINRNPTCSKYMQPSLRSSLEYQSDKQTNSDPNKERDMVPNERGTKVVLLNSQSDSDSPDLIEKRKRIKRKRSISRMPQLEREALQKILRMPLENLDAEGPRKKCNCSKTCALSKNNAADSKSNESTTCHRSSRDGIQSDILELSSSDEEMPVEPYKSPKEEREFWKQKYIDQEKKTTGIMQSLQKIKTKLDCQENAFADLRKQLTVDKNYAFIDHSSNEDDERTSRTEDEDKENEVKIHIKTKSQDIRLKGDWKEICSDFNELLKVLKIVSPTKSNNASTATVEELHDNELQSQAVANKVPMRRGRKPANKKRSVSSKGKSPQGRPKSKKNVEKDGTKKTQTPVRKSSRISMMKKKTFAQDSGDDEQSDYGLKLPESISSPAMSFIQSLNPNDYQDSIMSSSKTNRKKKKYSLCEERRTESHFMKSLLNESPNIKFANFSEQIREPKIMQEICDDIIFNQSKTSLTNTSSVTLPPTPEISSIKNMYRVNRRGLNGSTYTLYDTDVSMPQERTLYQLKDYLLSNNTKLNLKTKTTPNADITETQSLFALFGPLKEKIMSLFPGRAKETKPRRLTDSSVAVLDENKSMFHSNVNKAKKSLKRTSTPLKRNQTRKSEYKVIESIKEERLEFSPQYSQDETSVELLQQKDMSSYNIFDDQYKKKKTKPFGNEKKKFISKSSPSLCGSSDIESSLLQDSIELIHNHSETCIFANEQKYVPPPRSLSAITTPFKSTITSFEKEKIIDKTIFDPDLLNSDANDCYSPTLNNMFSASCGTEASNDVSYDGSMMDELSIEISPQPQLRASMCNLLAKNQSTDSSLFT